MKCLIGQVLLPNLRDVALYANVVSIFQLLGIELSHPDDLSSFDYELHKNLVTYVLHNDDVEHLELPSTLDVLNPWNNRPTTLALFPDHRDDKHLSDKNKVQCGKLYKTDCIMFQ